MLSCLVDGFNNGILHLTPICYELILLKFISDSLGYGLNTLFGGILTLQLEHKNGMIITTLVLLIIGIIINVIHLIFSCLEIASCQTILCLNNYWFFFCFLFILGFIIVLEIIMWFYFLKYKRYVYLSKLWLAAPKNKKV